MRQARLSKTAFAVPIWLFLGLLSTCLYSASPEQENRTPPYPRAEAKTIRQVTQEVLHDKNYAPRKTIWQWIGEKLSGFTPRLGNYAGLGKFVVIFLVTWCVLTLLAIFIHFIWTIVVYFRSNSSRSMRARHFTPIKSKEVSFEQLQQQMMEFARLGRWREAVERMMQAMIQGLHIVKVVHFHPSKTNGEYLFEYKSSRSRETFQGFIQRFDGMIYGGQSCGSEEYQAMRKHFEAILAYVRQEKE